MKLKLTPKEEHTILSVTEKLTTQDIAVLKAGLNKLFQKNPQKNMILDLSSFSEADLQPAEVMASLGTLQSWAKNLGAPLMLISPIKGLGDAPTLQEATQTQSSPLAKSLAQEARLRVQLKNWQQKKTEMEQKFSSLSNSAVDVKSILEEHSTLKNLIASLELLIRQTLSGKKADVFETETIKTKTQVLHQILVNQLQQDTILPIGVPSVGSAQQEVGS